MKYVSMWPTLWFLQHEEPPPPAGKATHPATSPSGSVQASLGLEIEEPSVSASEGRSSIAAGHNLTL